MNTELSIFGVVGAKVEYRTMAVPELAHGIGVTVIRITDQHGRETKIVLFPASAEPSPLRGSCKSVLCTRVALGRACTIPGRCHGARGQGSPAMDGAWRVRTPRRSLHP